MLKPGIQGIRILSLFWPGVVKMHVIFFVTKIGENLGALGTRAAARTPGTVSAPCIFKYAPKSDVSMQGLLERV